MSCIPLGIVLFRTTDETYGESKPRKIHNLAFKQLYTRLQIDKIHLNNKTIFKKKVFENIFGCFFKVKNMRPHPKKF